MRRGFSGNVNIGDELRHVVSVIEEKEPDLADSARMQLAWRKAVDTRVLEHTATVFVVPNTCGSEVLVYVDSPLWATDMNMQAERFRMYLNIAFADLYAKDVAVDSADVLLDVPKTVEKVKRLKFVASKDRYAGRGKRMSMVEIFEEEEEGFRVKPVPLSASDEDELQAAAADIEDEKLRSVALEAARANLGRQKALEDKAM